MKDFMSEPLIRAHIFDCFEPFAATRGLDFDSLIARAGITRADIADPDNEIPLNAVATLLANAAAESGDACLGLHYAESYPPGAAGVLGYMLLNSKSIRAAVQGLVRYVALHLDPIEISYQESDGQGHLTWRYPPTFTAPRTHYTIWAMAVIVIRLRSAGGPNWMPVGVEFEHRELPCRDEVLRLLGPNVRYDCPANTLHIRESILNKSFEDADARLFDIIRKLGERMLADRRKSNDIVEQTRMAIVAQLDTGEITLEDVAARMDLSVRVLQSRLAAADASFDTVLQETRRDMAETLLRDTDLPLTEIAFLLGFSEHSAFTRAAGKWFGAPPRQHRAVLRQQIEVVRM